MVDRARRPDFQAEPRCARPRVRRRVVEAAYQKLLRSLVRRARWKHRLGREDASDVVGDAFVVALDKLGARACG